MYVYTCVCTYMYVCMGLCVYVRGVNCIFWEEVAGFEVLVGCTVGVL